MGASSSSTSIVPGRRQKAKTRSLPQLGGGSLEQPYKENTGNASRCFHSSPRRQQLYWFQVFPDLLGSLEVTSLGLLYRSSCFFFEAKCSTFFAVHLPEVFYFSHCQENKQTHKRTNKQKKRQQIGGKPKKARFKLNGSTLQLVLRVTRFAWSGNISRLMAMLNARRFVTIQMLIPAISGCRKEHNIPCVACEG